MKALLYVSDQALEVDFSSPIALGIPMSSEKLGVRAWWSKGIEIAPVVMGDFIGDLAQGSPVNFKTLTLSPHGNSTHTECVGHIVQGPYSIGSCLKQNTFVAQLISVEPQQQDNGDWCITAQQLAPLLLKESVEALVLRTLPNTLTKLQKDYSGTHPPYFTPEAIAVMNRCGIQHLLVDLPSVDPEMDGGLLLAHKEFWGVPTQIQAHKTITELVFIPDSARDGLYVLQLGVLALELDASPSNPILYSVKNKNVD